MTVRTAVLVSGGGSNLGAILAAQHDGRLAPAKVVLVISSRAGVKALDIAAGAGVPTQVIEKRAYPTEDAFQAEILKALKTADVQLVCLAGYLRRLSPAIIAAYRERILNIHPALLPSFGGAGMYGRHVHEAVIKAAKAVSGCTVHLVDEEFDHGRTLAQAKVPVQPDDTPELLAARVLQEEHQLYPKTIAAFAAALSGASHD